MKKFASGIVVLVSAAMLAGTALYLKSQGGFDLANENLWTTGKIFVVICVISLIFIGILFFLLHLESKIEKLEHTITDKK